MDFIGAFRYIPKFFEDFIMLTVLKSFAPMLQPFVQRGEAKITFPHQNTILDFFKRERRAVSN